MTHLVAPNHSVVLDRPIQKDHDESFDPTRHLPPTLEASAELQFLYSYFNERLFEGQLPDCMVVFTRKKCFGYFAPNRFRNLDGELVPELGLNPTYLSAFGDLEACKTMAHEQAHVARYYFGPLNRNGKRPNSGYHDKHWGAIMRKIGLMPSHTGKPGGKELGYQMMEYVIEGGRFELVCEVLFSEGFKLKWGDNLKPQAATAESVGLETSVASTAKPKKRDRIKFTCPSCSLNAWAKPSAKLICGECKIQMAAADRASTLSVPMPAADPKSSEN